MITTASPKLLAALKDGRAKIIRKIQIVTSTDKNNPKSFTFVTGDQARFGYMNCAAHIAPVSLKLDPWTREVTLGEMTVTFGDDGVARRIVRSNYLIGKELKIWIGTDRNIESEFAPIFDGRILAPRPDLSSVDITAEDIRAIALDRKIKPDAVRDQANTSSGAQTMGGLPQFGQMAPNGVPILAMQWINWHPCGVMMDLLVRAGVPYNLIDIGSFFGANNVLGVSSFYDISHFNLTRAGVRAAQAGINMAITAPVETRKLIGELCQLVPGAVIPNDAGVLQFKRYDPTLPAVRNYTELDVTDFEIVEPAAPRFNEVGYKFNKEDGNFVSEFTLGNDNAQRAAGWVDGTKDVTSATPIESEWLNARTRLFASIGNGTFASTGAKVFILAPSMGGFCGARGLEWGIARQSTDDKLSPGRPGYLKIVDLGTGNNEIVEVTNCKPDSSDGSSPLIDTSNLGTLGFVREASFDIVRRGCFGTTESIHTASGVGCWVEDYTIAAYMTQQKLRRFGYGVQTIRYRTNAGEFPVEVGDQVTHTNRRFLAYNYNGSDSTLKFEVTMKEDHLDESSPGYVFEATRSSEPLEAVVVISTATAPPRKTLTVVGEKLSGTEAITRKFIKSGGGNIDVSSGLVAGFAPAEILGHAHYSKFPGGNVTQHANRDTWYAWDLALETLTIVEKTTPSIAPTWGPLEVPLWMTTTSGVATTATVDLRVTTPFAGMGGGGSILDVSLPDNTAPTTTELSKVLPYAYRIHEGVNDYFAIDTRDGFEQIRIGSGTPGAPVGTLSVVFNVPTVFFGNGVSSVSPTVTGIAGTRGNGVDCYGSPLWFVGGLSTGLGVGGEAAFFTSPVGGGSGSSYNTALRRFSIVNSGDLYFGEAGIGGKTTAPIVGKWIVSGIGAGNAGNLAGTNLTFQLSQSSGTGVGGSLIVQGTPAGGAGAALNAYSTLLTVPAVPGLIYVAAGGSSGGLAISDSGVSLAGLVSTTIIGQSARATGGSSTVIGTSASSTGTSSVIIGASAVGASNNVVIGGSATAASKTSALAIGQGAAAGTQGISLGAQTNTTTFAGIAIGFGALTTVAKQCVIGDQSTGSPSANVTDLWLGGVAGVSGTIPLSVTIHTSNSTGTDIAGADLIYSAGRSTGTGVPGAHRWFDSVAAGGSSSTLNATTEVMRLDGGTLRLMTGPLRLDALGADPATIAGQVSVYSKDVAGLKQLFARISDGTVYQITPPGAGASISVSDEGSAIGSATVLDFRGTGVTATFAAGTATIRVVDVANTATVGQYLPTAAASGSWAFTNSGGVIDLTKANSLAVGPNGAYFTQANATAIGSDAAAEGDGATSLGAQAGAFATRSVAIGYSASVNGSATDSIALGMGAFASGAGTNRIIIGSSTSQIRDLFLGAGDFASAPPSCSIQPSPANYFSVPDTAGGDLSIFGGQSNGLGVGGRLRLKASTTGLASGLPLNPTADALVIEPTGAAHLIAKPSQLGGSTVLGGMLSIDDRVSDPAALAASGQLFAKTVGSAIELHYEDNLGTVTQLTARGQLGGNVDDMRRLLEQMLVVLQDIRTAQNAQLEAVAPGAPAEEE